MKKLLILGAVAFSAIVVYSCHKEKDTLTTTAYLDLPAKTPEYFTTSGTFLSKEAIDSMNRVATLGRVLFYDTRLSVNNAIACGSCHKQELGFADNVRFSRGFEGRLTGRNSPGINGINADGLLFWDGRERILDNLIARPISNHVEMGIDDLNTLPTKLAEIPYYKQLFKDAYNNETVTLDGISKAVACFLESINPNMNRTVILLGSTNDLTPLQLKGKALFDTVYNCGTCHISGGGGGYTGGGVMLDIGLDQNYADNGGGVISGNKRDNGTFKVPNLTNVALTAPYMHDGRFKTLDEVLEHYSHGINNSPNLSPILKDKEINGKPIKMNITASDKQAIIAFLGSLTDTKTNTDPKFSNPFKVK